MKGKMFVLFQGVAFMACLCLSMSCAGSNIQIAKEDRATIESVVIDKNVTIPDEPYIQGGNARTAFLLMGGAGVALEGMSASKAFKAYMEKNKIDLGKIVLESFEVNIKQDNILPLRSDGNYKLKLKVNAFGFGESRFLGLVTPKVYRKPLMNITASLVDANNKVVWAKTDYLTPQSDKLKEYTFEELVENPQKTAESLTQIAQLLAESVMDDFRKNQVPKVQRIIKVRR